MKLVLYGYLVYCVLVNAAILFLGRKALETAGAKRRRLRRQLRVIKGGKLKG